MKKDKLEAVTRKKKKERKEELQGEAAMDKPQVPNKTTASITHLTSRSTETQDKKVLCSSQCSPMGLSKALTGLLEQSRGRVSPEEQKYEAGTPLREVQRVENLCWEALVSTSVALPCSASHWGLHPTPPQSLKLF